MTGPLHAPLLTPEQANQLLEGVVYERVLGFIDVEELFEFERELWHAYDDAEIAENAEVPKLVKAMVDRALIRFCDEPRRYNDFGTPNPLIGVDPYGDCELCEQEPREAKATQQKTS